MLFLFTLLSGVLVSQGGRPYNPVIFGVHKLIALATVIVLAVIFRDLLRSGDTANVVELGVIAITCGLFLALIVTGALLSLDLQLSGLVLMLHQVAPVLSLISSAVTIILLVRSA